MMIREKEEEKIDDKQKDNHLNKMSGNTIDPRIIFQHHIALSTGDFLSEFVLTKNFLGRGKLPKGKRLQEVVFVANSDAPEIKGLQFMIPTPSNMLMNTCGGNFSRGLNLKIEDLSVFYFEVEVIRVSEKEFSNALGVGFQDRNHLGTISGGFVGWDHGSVGFHNDNGRIYNNNGHSDEIFEKYGSGDVVGIGCYKSKTNDKLKSQWSRYKVFFTKNGKRYEKEHVALFEKYQKTLGSTEFLCGFYPTVTTLHYDSDRDDVCFKINNGEDTIRFPFRYRKFNVQTPFAEKNMLFGFADLKIGCCSLTNI